MRCALGCGKTDNSLHRFPNPRKCPEQFKAWVTVMGEIIRDTNDYLMYKNKRICDIHFTKKDRNRNNRLNTLAVPSQHLPMWCNKPYGTTISSVALSNANTIVKKVRYNKYDNTMTILEILPNVQKEHNNLPSHRRDHTYHASWQKAAVSSPENLHNENSTTETDYIDVTIDDEGTEPPEVEDSNNGPFTWQKQAITCADDESTCIVGDEPGSIHESKDAQKEQSMIVDLETVVESEGEEQEHGGYRCNECAGDIVGFRYVCVQCSDYDVCAACEARGAHRRHYALRVPPRKPRGEVQRVIEAIQKCINDDPSFIFLPADDSVKIEIKNEDEEQSNETECESDPLMVPTAQSLPEEETIRQVPVLEQGPLHLSNTEHINKQPVFNSSSVPDTGQDYREVYYLSSDEPESILSRTKVDGQNCLVDDNNPTNSVKESDEQNNLVLLRNATPETESNVKLKLTNATNYLTKDLSGQTCVKSKNLLVKLNRLDMSKLGVLSERRLKNIKKTSTFKR